MQKAERFERLLVVWVLLVRRLVLGYLLLPLVGLGRKPGLWASGPMRQAAPRNAG